MNMKSIYNLREKYYKYGRLFAIIVISPYLICKGKEYNDTILIIIGILIILWDSIKLIYS